MSKIISSRVDKTTHLELQELLSAARKVLANGDVSFPSDQHALIQEIHQNVLQLGTDLYAALDLNAELSVEKIKLNSVLGSYKADLQKFSDVVFNLNFNFNNPVFIDRALASLTKEGDGVSLVDAKTNASKISFEVQNLRWALQYIISEYLVKCNY